MKLQVLTNQHLGLFGARRKFVSMARQNAIITSLRRGSSGNPG